MENSKNVHIQNRISELIDAILENPTEGIGNPEALKHEYAGFWSRRINKEHRIVYRFNESMVEVVQLRFHY